jgi:hypothetical protein
MNWMQSLFGGHPEEIGMAHGASGAAVDPVNGEHGAAAIARMITFL